MTRTGGVLVVGADAAIGRSLASALRAEGAGVWETTRRGRRDAHLLDLGGDVASWPIPAGVETAFVCAAVTSTADCRERPDASRAINVEGTVTLARRLVAEGCRVIFPSTNMVFDGSCPFAPRDLPVSPRTAYGRMKAEAEARLRELGDAVSIVRLAKVLGRSVPLFEDWRASLRAGRPIHPLADMVMAPISLDAAVDALRRVGRSAAQGIIQLSATGEVSYADAARRLAAMMIADPGLVQPRTVEEAGLRLEHVARHATLEVSGIEAALGILAPDPWQAIDEAIAT